MTSTSPPSGFWSFAGMKTPLACLRGSGSSVVLLSRALLPSAVLLRVCSMELACLGTAGSGISAVSSKTNEANNRPCMATALRLSGRLPMA